LQPLCDQEWLPDTRGDFAPIVGFDAAFPAASDKSNSSVDSSRPHPRRKLNAFEQTWADFLNAVVGSR
jgi:hypothetical protein